MRTGPGARVATDLSSKSPGAAVSYSARATSRVGPASVGAVHLRLPPHHCADGVPTPVNVGTPGGAQRKQQWFHGFRTHVKAAPPRLRPSPCSRDLHPRSLAPKRRRRPVHRHSPPRSSACVLYEKGDRGSCSFAFRLPTRHGRSSGGIPSGGDRRRAAADPRGARCRPAAGAAACRRRRNGEDVSTGPGPSPGDGDEVPWVQASRGGHLRAQGSRRREK